MWRHACFHLGTAEFCSFPEADFLPQREPKSKKSDVMKRCKNEKCTSGDFQILAGWPRNKSLAVLKWCVHCGFFSALRRFFPIQRHRLKSEMRSGGKEQHDEICQDNWRKLFLTPDPRGCCIYIYYIVIVGYSGMSWVSGPGPPRMPMWKVKGHGRLTSPTKNEWKCQLVILWPGLPTLKVCLIKKIFQPREATPRFEVFEECCCCWWPKLPRSNVVCLSP